MQNMIVRIGALVLLLGLYSCSSQNQETKSREKDDGLEVVITTEAGSRLTRFSPNSHPPFFNLAIIEGELDENIIVLGQKKRKGTKHLVHPCALMEFRLDSTVINYVISVTKKDAEFLDVNYDNFLAYNHDLQLALTSWFRSQCPFGNCSDFKWKNQYKALLKLNREE